MRTFPKNRGCKKYLIPPESLNLKPFHWFLCIISHYLSLICIKIGPFHFSNTIWPLSLSSISRTHMMDSSEKPLYVYNKNDYEIPAMLLDNLTCFAKHELFAIYIYLFWNTNQVKRFWKTTFIWCLTSFVIIFKKYKVCNCRTLCAIADYTYFTPKHLQNLQTTILICKTSN